MKRLILGAVLACAIVPLVTAQVLDKPAATVRLVRTESVTVSMLQKAVALYEAQARRPLTADERRQVLDELISKALILQAASRDNVVTTEAELRQATSDYQKQMGAVAGLGRPLNDQELQQLLSRNGMTSDAFQKQLRDQQTVLDYLRRKKPTLFDTLKVTDSEIQDFYDQNKQNFFVNDMITVKHIFVNTQQLTSKDDRDKAARHADDILKELTAGATFDSLVVKYSEDIKSKYNGGQFSLFRNDSQMRQALGTAFFDSVFRMKKGETSAVLQSNIGFHIVQVVDRVDAHLLGLTDKIPPQNTTTVRDAINQQLMAQRQADAYKSGLSDIVADLKKQAEIRIFDDNIAAQ